MNGKLNMEITIRHIGEKRSLEHYKGDLTNEELQTIRVFMERLGMRD